MRTWFIVILYSLMPVAAASTQGETPAALKLIMPIDCTLEKTCWIARYNDRISGPKKGDYACEGRTQDNHFGTDFTLANFGQMKSGVSIIAAASGTIAGLRNSEPDISIQQREKGATKGKECGNGIVVKHNNGWTTQYCHMKKNSLAVKVGDTVTAGAKLGEVGLSGQTEYPHLHFVVRHKGERIDPFDGQPLTATCDTGDTKPLWARPIPYSPFAFVSATLTIAPPNRQTRWNASAKTIKADAPALILTGRVFGAKEGDKWWFKILRPDGSVFSEQGTALKKDRQFQIQYIGKKRPTGGFTPGIWTGDLVIIRQHTDGTITHTHKTTSIAIKTTN